jgi:hypothetical protein
VLQGACLSFQGASSAVVSADCLVHVANGALGCTCGALCWHHCRDCVGSIISIMCLAALGGLCGSDLHAVQMLMDTPFALAVLAFCVSCKQQCPVPLGYTRALLHGCICPATQ